MNAPDRPGERARSAPRLTSTEVKRALDDPRALCLRLGLADRARRQRGGLMILCPWHPEKNPSCSVRLVNDGTIAVRCHACGASGDALSLVAAARGLDVKTDFRAVLAEAASVAGLHVAASDARAARPPLAKAGAARARRARHLPPEPKLDDATFSAMAAVVLAAGRLDESPIAADVTRYLARRKLLDVAIEDGWAALPPPGEAQAAWARVLRDLFGAPALALSGLTWERDGELTLAYPKHRLVIPWRSPDGAVLTLQRRRIDRIAERKYVFPAGRPARFPYGIERLRAWSEHAGEPVLAIVEGAVDALAFRWLARRDRFACIELGLAGVQSWDAAWARHAGERAVIGLDADQAGHLAVGGIAHDLVLAGVERLERWKPRAGKDWADTVMEERTA
jgi:DNA primase